VAKVGAPLSAKLPRLLIVDDDEAIRQVTADSLRELGYQIETAEDGAAALEVIGAFQPDLVITDLRMPKMSGFELLEILRSRFPRMPVIAMSGEFRGDVLPPGVIADAFLAKGGGIHRLRTTVSELLAISPLRAESHPAVQRDHPVTDGDADIMAVYRRLGAAEKAEPPLALGPLAAIPVQARDGSQ
jgi:CheY-like chemotaxis protein